MMTQALETDKVVAVTPCPVGWCPEQGHHEWTSDKVVVGADYRCHELQVSDEVRLQFWENVDDPNPEHPRVDYYREGSDNGITGDQAVQDGVALIRAAAVLDGGSPEPMELPSREELGKPLRFEIDPFEYPELVFVAERSTLPNGSLWGPEVTFSIADIPAVVEWLLLVHSAAQTTGARA